MDMNYKGQYYDDQGNEVEEEKYTCPMTGAHFRFEDICYKLLKIQKTRTLSLNDSKKIKIVEAFEQENSTERGR
jgi:hypothetical protein